MEPYRTDDITFCSSPCDRRSCFRHPSNRIDKFRPYTAAELRGTVYCEARHLPEPKRKRRKRQ